MKVTLQSTTRLIELATERGGPAVPARVWEGQTETGIPVVAFITRIAPAIEDPPAGITQDFEAELESCRVPEVDVTLALPARLVL